MKFPLCIFASITLMLAGMAAAGAPSLKECPKEVLKLLQGDVRRAFLNVTFTVTDQSSEDAKIAELVSKAFGGPYLTFDSNDKDNEYQVSITDGEGDKKRTISFLYNRSKIGWVMAGVLLGAFPVGSEDKHDGWRDITTREPMKGPGSPDWMRTYRYTNGLYSLIKHSVESGG
ncbi:MAG: hypothetical protein V4689_05360 [Verrucomicrobiota bacterium]